LTELFRCSIKILCTTVLGQYTGLRRVLELFLLLLELLVEELSGCWVGGEVDVVAPLGSLPCKEL
jgi:hypothetical protein